MLTRAEIQRLERPAPLVAPSLRDLIAVPFRRRKITLVCIIGTLVLAVLAAVLFPHYEAAAKILLKRDRVDPLLSPSPESSKALAGQPMISDEDMRSEVELMNSADVLSKVVTDLHLATAYTPSAWDRITGRAPMSESDRISAATIKLQKDLSISPSKGSYIIEVVYKSKDRFLAQQVVKSVLDAYLEKHTSVHRPLGEYRFFSQQAEQFRQGLQEAEEKLKSFPSKYGVVAPTMSRDLTVQKLNEFQSSGEQSRAAIAETRHRMRDLNRQAESTPERITTQLKRSDNAQLAQQLKGTLLTLQLKRSEMLMKYQPSYRPVKELEQQIADTRDAIEREAKNPLRDETTDLDQTYQLLRAERAKAEADLAAHTARLAATKQIVKRYEAQARALDSDNIVQADLLRNLKTQEDNYLLYQRKSEEARITDALDAKRMVNVAVVQQPTAPPFTSHPRWIYAFLALGLGGIGSMVVLGTSEYFDAVLHTPKQVETYIDIPVLASLPMIDENRRLAGNNES